jgi:hypothetical protein
MFKQGWCAGHLLTIREMIMFWQVQVVNTIAILNGNTNPSAGGTGRSDVEHIRDDMYSERGQRGPNGSNTRQMAS